MRLQFDVEITKFIRMRKMINYMSRFFNHTSRLFIIVEMDEQQINTKISGTIRFFLNSDIFQVAIVFRSINYLSRLHLKFKGNQSVAIFEIMDVNEFFQFFNHMKNSQFQKLEFSLKKGRQQDPERYLQIIEKSELNMNSFRFQLSPPITLEDCNFWEPQQNPALNIVNMQTIYLRNLINTFMINKSKFRFLIDINKQQNSYIFGLVGQLNYSVTIESFQQVEISGGQNQFNLQGNIPESILQNFLNTFQGGQNMNLMYTKKKQLLFGFQEQDCAKYIKFIPYKSVKQEGS